MIAQTLTRATSQPRTLALLTAGIVLLGCTARSTSHASPQLLSAPLPASRSETLLCAAEGLRRFEKRELKQASGAFQMALKLDPANSWLHFLNAVTYHLRALEGDTSFFELAETGYRMAIRFDPSNWLAHYQLGLLHLDRKDPWRAQEALSEAILFCPEDPDLLYAMVEASYASGDPVTAGAVVGALRRIEPDSARALRASAVVAASLRRPEEATDFLERYRCVAKTPEACADVEARLRDWAAFHECQDNTDDHSSQPNDAPTAAPTPPQDRFDKMVLVDVVILRSDEEVAERKGVNILSGLELEFGSGTPGAHWEYQKSKETEGSKTVSRNFTTGIDLPSLTYSLNIFNSIFDHTEIIARPTLVAMDGNESNFFSGISVDAAVVTDGSGYSDPVEISGKEIGVTLRITPRIQTPDQVQLDVYAERTFLESPSEDVDFTHQILVSHTHVQASVIMGLDETLVLSGLSEMETLQTRNGVPLLQDIPGVQYLFSQKDTRDFQRSVLILITPRLPDYVYSNDPQTAARMRRRRPVGTTGELKERHPEWFRPYETTDLIFQHLESNSLYREFRTGDIYSSRWQDTDSFVDRLRRAVGVLYY